MRYLIKFSYDGSNYNGYQYQKNLPSIQESLEIALTKVNNNQKTTATATGRTDKGVHALCQYAHADININITEEIYNIFDKYYNLLVEWNTKFNMTSILDKKQVFLLHFYDSICLSKYINLKEECSLCDFGTGAGFPGMVIAILFKKVTIIY